MKKIFKIILWGYVKCQNFTARTFYLDILFNIIQVFLLIRDFIICDISFLTFNITRNILLVQFCVNKTLSNFVIVPCFLFSVCDIGGMAAISSALIAWIMYFLYLLTFAWLFIRRTKSKWRVDPFYGFKIYVINIHSMEFLSSDQRFLQYENVFYVHQVFSTFIGSTSHSFISFRNVHSHVLLHTLGRKVAATYNKLDHMYPCVLQYVFLLV